MDFSNYAMQKPVLLNSVVNTDIIIMARIVEVRDIKLNMTLVGMKLFERSLEILPNRCPAYSALQCVVCRYQCSVIIEICSKTRVSKERQNHNSRQGSLF